MKLPKGLWKLSEVCCRKCHLTPTGIFIFSNHSQTSPLELITFTWSSQLSWDFPPESQKSSAYPSACLTQTCMYVCLHIPTPWLQPGLLCYPGTSFAAFSPRILFSLPYFPILKLTPISLSLLCSQYFKQVIHAEEEPKWRKLLNRSSSAVSEGRKGGRKERRTCSEISPPSSSCFFQWSLYKSCICYSREQKWLQRLKPTQYPGNKLKIIYFLFQVLWNVEELISLLGMGEGKSISSKICKVMKKSALPAGFCFYLHLSLNHLSFNLLKPCFMLERRLGQLAPYVDFLQLIKECPMTVQEMQ